MTNQIRSNISALSVPLFCWNVPVNEYRYLIIILRGAKAHAASSPHSDEIYQRIFWESITIECGFAYYKITFCYCCTIDTVGVMYICGPSKNSWKCWNLLHDIAWLTQEILRHRIRFLHTSIMQRLTLPSVKYVIYTLPNRTEVIQKQRRSLQNLKQNQRATGWKSYLFSKQNSKKQNQEWFRFYF